MNYDIIDQNEKTNRLPFAAGPSGPASFARLRSRASEGRTPAAERTGLSGNYYRDGRQFNCRVRPLEEQAYPALLQKKLLENGFRFKVINAGISGETSSGALARVDWILTLKPDIVILETGANDGLRGISPELVEAISASYRTLPTEDVVVVLAGMQMVPNLGPEYTRAFADLYKRIAEQEEVIFIPFFLEGVAGEQSLNQEDTIHPTSAGYRKVVETIYPYVVQAIKTLQNRRTEEQQNIEPQK